MQWGRDKADCHQWLNFLPIPVRGRRSRHFLHNEARQSLDLPNEVTVAVAILTSLPENRAKNLFQLCCGRELCREGVPTGERPTLRKRRPNNHSGSRAGILRRTLEEEFLDIQLLPTPLSTAYKRYSSGRWKRPGRVFTKPKIPEHAAARPSWKLHRLQIGHAEQEAKEPTQVLIALFGQDRVRSLHLRISSLLQTQSNVS